MLIGCVTFSSLCFSNIIEAIQTLLHISHNDEMHYPIPVFCVGAFGLVMNGLSYLLIGGIVNINNFWNQWGRFSHCARLTGSFLPKGKTGHISRGGRILEMGRGKKEKGMSKNDVSMVACKFKMALSIDKTKNRQIFSKFWGNKFFQLKNVVLYEGWHVEQGTESISENRHMEMRPIELFFHASGYTFHHGSCLRVTSTGVVVMEETLKSNYQRKLNLSQCKQRSSAGAREICRDVIGKWYRVTKWILLISAETLT